MSDISDFGDAVWNYLRPTRTSRRTRGGGHAKAQSASSAASLLRQRGYSTDDSWRSPRTGGAAAWDESFEDAIDEVGAEPQSHHSR